MTTQQDCDLFAKAIEQAERMLKRDEPGGFEVALKATLVQGVRNGAVLGQAIILKRLVTVLGPEEAYRIASLGGFATVEDMQETAQEAVSRLPTLN